MNNSNNDLKSPTSETPVNFKGMPQNMTIEQLKAMAKSEGATE